MIKSNYCVPFSGMIALPNITVVSSLLDLDVTESAGIP